MLDKQELIDWYSHLVPMKLLNQCSHVVILEFTKHNRHVPHIELTNHNEREHWICTLAALPMRNCHWINTNRPLIYPCDKQTWLTNANGRRRSSKLLLKTLILLRISCQFRSWTYRVPIFEVHFILCIYSASTQCT